MPRAKKQDAAAPGNIEDTLAALDIDKTLPADAAAQEAAKDTNDEPAITSIEFEEEEGDIDDEGGSDDDKDDDDEDAATSTVVTKSKAKEKAPTFLQAVPTELKAEPRRVAVPPPKETKARKAVVPTRSPSTGKMGKGISEKVPGAEKVKVYKRVDGQRWYIKDYTKDDLAGFSDMESFLTTYVKPKHGHGIYDLTGLDAHGREMELGIVRLIDTGEGTPNASPDGGAFSFAQKLLADQQKQNKEYLERMEQLMQPQQQPNPVSQLKDLMEVQKSLGGEAKEAEARAEQARLDASAKQEGGFAAMIQAMGQQSSQQMQAMLAMMQQQAQQQAQQTQLLVAAMQPKQDPMMAALMAKMLEEKESKSSSSAALPPPPPPPPDPMEGLAKLLMAITPLIGGGGGEPPPDDFKEFAKVALMKQLEGGGASAHSESDEFKELAKVILMKQVEGGTGTDKFKEATDHLAMLMNVANAMRQQTEGGATAGFFDALAALFSNRDFAGSIASGIRKKAEGSNPQLGASAGAPQGGAAAALQQQNQQLRQALLQQQQQIQMLMQGLQGGGQMPQGAAPVAQPAGLGEAPAQPPAKTGPHPELTQDQVDGALSQQSTNLPPLPTNTHEHINGITTAADDAERVERTIRMLIYFAEFDEWRPFSEQLLGVAASGNLEGTLEILGTFFKTLSGMGLVDKADGVETLRAVRDNFDEIVKNLADFFAPDEDVSGSELRGELPPEDLEDEEDGDEDLQE